MITKEEFLQKVDDDLIWRRRELSNLKGTIQGADLNPVNRAALLRAGVALLYAHWEGFVKSSGTYYLKYVSLQGAKGSELRPNFIAIKFKAALMEATRSKKPSATADLVDYFCMKLGNRLNIPYKGVVNTESNLSSSIFREIVWSLGLDMAPFETKCHLIDSSLLERRNHIAHGSYIDVDINDYLALQEEVVSLMEAFRTQIQNAVVSDGHVRQ